jgi:hypothetical protein
MYDSKTIIRFLHYDMFRPLFLAIIRYYLYIPSQLFCYPPYIGHCLQLEEGHIVVYNLHLLL